MKRATFSGIAALLVLSVVPASSAVADPVNGLATTTVAEAGSVTLVSAPLQTLVAVSSSTSGVTFTTGASDVGSSASLGMPGFVSGGGEAVAMTSSGMVTGTTINGEALSVSVGGSLDGLSGGTNTANGGMAVVIAQYN